MINTLVSRGLATLTYEKLLVGITAAGRARAEG
jgi:hypothetical protein